MLDSTSSNEITEIGACRICGGPLRIALDLGALYPSDFIDPTRAELAERVPLQLADCSGCGLVQLKHTVNPDSVYRHYWYQSSLNSSMVEALQDVVRGISTRAVLEPGDIVLDIGANDGTLLSFYPKHVVTVGFDPAENLASLARRHTKHFVNDYFSAARYPLEKPAKVITSIAMFYDLDDPLSFTADIAATLDPQGVWVVQMTDLVSMLKANAFDNLCLEHLEYYSLRVLAGLVQECGLEVFDVEYNSVNGGSLRAYIGHAGSRGIAPSVPAALREEDAYLGQFANPVEAFSERVSNARRLLLHYLMDLKLEGKTVYALGASTKGNTLLQYYGLNATVIPYAAEVHADKVGRYTVGSEIPIVSEAQAFADAPDYFLILPWHFAENIASRHASYLAAGGKFIVPLPQPAVISKNGWEEIRYPVSRSIDTKSVGFMIDELVTTSIKRHYLPEQEGLLADREAQLSRAIESRLRTLNLPEGALETNAATKDLVSSLVDTLIDCWNAQETVMAETCDVEVAKAAKEAQRLNAVRNQLIRTLDEQLGEATITVTAKTYG